MKVRVEKVDDITNEIMDIVRENFNLNPDSDKDDEIYTLIWNIIDKQIK